MRYHHFLDGKFQVYICDDFQESDEKSGYRAPEVILSGQYSLKSDVHSFGVVMLQLLTGRKAFDRSRPRAEQPLVRWAAPQLHRHRRAGADGRPRAAPCSWVTARGPCRTRSPRGGSRSALDTIALCVQAQNIRSRGARTESAIGQSRREPRQCRGGDGFFNSPRLRLQKYLIAMMTVEVWKRRDHAMVITRDGLKL